MNNIWERIKWNIENSRFFSNNTTPKIVSIIFAIIMWLYVMGEVNPQSIIEVANVNVQLINVEELEQSGLVIMGQTDFYANIEVSGRRNDIYKLTAQDIVARADLRGFHKGLNSVPIEVSVSANGSITGISPKQIKITLDEIVKRQKPVIVQPVGTALKGFEPGEVSVSPKEVIVEGPESLVNMVTMVLADVNIADRQEDVIEKLPFKAVDSEGKEVNGVEVKNKYVDVVLPILRVKEVPISISYEGAVKDGYRITKIMPNQEVIKIKGKNDIVKGINQIKAKPINLEGLNKTVRRDMQLVLPEGIETPYLDKNPNVSIIVEQIKSKDFDFEREEISIKNLNKEYVEDLSKFPNIIKVRVSAIESTLNEMKKEDIKLFINAEGLSDGLYYIDILYDISKKVDEVMVIPKDVDLIIKKEEIKKEIIEPTDEEINTKDSES